MGKSQTVGFRYYMPLHFISAICRGPSAIGVAVRDCLFGVVAGDKLAWEGEVFDNSTIQINAPELFGGNEKEGGIIGSLDVLFGAPDQPVNAYLEAAQGSPQDLGNILGQERQVQQQQGGLGGGLLGAVLDQDGDGQLGLGDLLKVGMGAMRGGG